MDSNEFRRRGKEMVDYVADYLDNIKDRPVFPSVKPGYLPPLMPREAPNEPEHWESIMSDVERLVMPGMTHWHHPRFHAYFPSGNSYASLCGDLLANGIGCVGFSWASSPACTELEVVMMDWLGRMLALPDEFLHSKSKGRGGGVVNGSASESTLTALLAARNRAISATLKEHPHLTPHEVAARLVGYYSEEAHSSVARAGLISMLQLRGLRADDQSSLRGDVLLEAIEEDIAAGKIPFFCLATLGTTNSCAFDNLEEMGEVTSRYPNIWLHVDAAYAGAAFICPEYRQYLNGIEHVMSFNFNPQKWLLINLDISAAFYRDVSYIVDSFFVDPVYLRHDAQGNGPPDFRHWHIPLGRRFRAMKMWFVFRLYGVTGLQAYIRSHCALAKRFEKLILRDGRFTIVQKVTMGLVCFRLHGENKRTKDLFEMIKEDGRIHLVTGEFKRNNCYFLRFALCKQEANEDDVDYAFEVISELTDRCNTGDNDFHNGFLI